MAQDSFDADPTKLPIAFRGYARVETEELFKRLAWEYAVLAGQLRELKKSMEALEPSARRRSELDEQAHALLNAARRVGRELREEARLECEQAIKKARSRAAEIEAEAERAAAETQAVAVAAGALRARLRETLRRLEHGEPLVPTLIAADLLPPRPAAQRATS